MRRVTSVASDISTARVAADAGRCWLAHRLRCRLVEAAWATAAAFGRDQVLLDHLQQLRDAQFVHAGPEVMSLGPQVFVHALRQPDRDNTGRLAFGVGRVLLLTELYQPFLDLLELLAFLERGQVFQAGELTADDAIDTQNLAEERYPVRLRFKELAGRLQNWLVLLRRLGKHGFVSFQVVRNYVLPSGPRSGSLFSGILKTRQVQSVMSLHCLHLR